MSELAQLIGAGHAPYIGFARCYECGEVATTGIYLMAGYVQVDGIEIGQSAHLCDAHSPSGSATSQPKDCKRVFFRFPEGSED